MKSKFGKNTMVTDLVTMFWKLYLMRDKRLETYAQVYSHRCGLRSEMAVLACLLHNRPWLVGLWNLTSSWLFHATDQPDLSTAFTSLKTKSYYLQPLIFTTTSNIYLEIKMALASKRRSNLLVFNPIYVSGILLYGGVDMAVKL